MTTALLLVALAVALTAPVRTCAVDRLATLPAPLPDDPAAVTAASPATTERPGRVLAVGAAASWLSAVLIVRSDASGLIVATAGAVLCAGAVRATGSRWASGSRAAPSDAVPMALDLVAACLRSGAALAVAVRAVADAPGVQLGDSFGRLAGILELGVDPADAAPMIADDPDAAVFVALASRSASSGMRLADVFTRHAEQLRRDRTDRGLRRANRVGAQALVPLGLCFLPAFVCLGVVPMVAGLAGQAVG
ncbi:MAG: type II secretion system F family protein [Jatrophihabitans sp.]